MTAFEEDGSRSDAPESFHVAFDTFATAIRRARGVAARESHGLTVSQYALLRALSGRTAARIGDLAGEAAITPSTATRILDALERREIVRRDRVSGDRRVVTVSLTERGRAALVRQERWTRERQDAFFASLPEVEQMFAPDLLRRLARLIDELAAGPEDRGD